MWYQQCAGASGWGGAWSTAQAAERAGRREATTPRRDARAELGAGLAQAANAAGHVRRDEAAVSRHVDPALARAFAKAWAGLWVTTGPCQHFYRKEFDLAHARDARLARNAAQVEAMLAPTHDEGPPYGTTTGNCVGTATASRAARANANVHADTDANANAFSSATAIDVDVDPTCRDIARWIDAVAATGDRGWHFRAARDALSLAGNLSLLAIIAACFYQEGATGDDGAPVAGRGASIANTPFGVPWADWTLLAFEGAKGVMTQSLGSPTLIRHHAVDEVLKRMDAGCRLLEACVLPSAPPPEAPSSWRGTLATLTRARDVATLFTFANTAVPPARLGLWIPSWFASEPSQSSGADGYRGVLRVAGLMLDSCRAVTSLLGTWARNAVFTLDARDLTRRWASLCERLATVSADDQAAVLDRVERVTQLATHCDTSLLAAIASSEALRERLLGCGESLTANDMAAACDAFDVPCHASCVDGHRYLSLHPAESPWGYRWKGEAWQCGGATPVRTSYRLLLLYQHWSAALLERVVSSCGTPVAQAPEVSPDDRPADPPGVARTRSGVAHVDIESTWV
ncbi:hypothetical protein PEP31012_02941 [Pandoraea eparura]|uniref:Uncharacterized protein n=1 Tax=Pandoraea eparura TaxID=2508291 RepID=A0A5E4VX40_9BURK|nr:hypothetical protein [Pandoraea eparura]VVE16968.1 hypothetical protein PEP31012_02941 [Pandoraea eparura]